jgi:signal recognition particle subunit SRP54
MFDSLHKGLSGIIRKLVSGSVDKKEVEVMLQDIRKILLQSDVDLKMTDQLVANIKKKALESSPPAGMTLREHVLKVIYDELVSLLGGKPSGLAGRKKIMMVGLFGSGKTTTTGKLAKYFIKQGVRPGLVALDYHRPAAPQQLEQLGRAMGVPVYVDQSKDVYKAAINGMEKLAKLDVIIFDTAGRNALDSGLAEEIKKLGQIIKPDEVLLVIPADLGKVAKSQSEEFHKLVGVTGVIITKMDGTAKAGGALAAASVTGAKVKFIGVGEKPDDLEVYDPTRFVSRLLGLGDLQTLLEKAKEIEIKKESVDKIVEGRFTLADFMEQIEAMEKMGTMSQIMSMIPGLSGRVPESALKQQEEKMKRYKYIMQSMTKDEKNYPDLINQSRIRRIAKGSGRTEAEVRELINQYSTMKKMMRQLGGRAGMQRGQMKQLAKQLGLNF